MRICYLILLILLPVLGFGQQWKNFTDTAGYFTAQYPSQWVNKIKPNNRVFFTSPAENPSDDFFENINISVTADKTYGEKAKVAEFLPEVVGVLKESIKEFKEESRRIFKWNNMDAAEIIYTGYGNQAESPKIRSTQWYCFYKSRMYIVTFVATADNNTHNHTAKKIMTSIVFK
jgi:hypothetical protein